MNKDIEIIHYAVALIDPSPYQVREHFDAESLQELANSIKEHGIIQPLTARVSPQDPARLELVAGERRWRAAGLAGLDTVPVIVRELSDLAAQEIVLIENLQREDLTVSEEARGYQKALSLVGPDGQPIYTQRSLATKIGKPWGHVTDRLKLLICPEELVKAVERREVSLSTAMLVGRIPDSKLRQQAAQKVLKPETQEVPLNYEQTQEMIRESFMVSLKKPGFDIEDADLVPELKDDAGGRLMGGSCVGCPFCQQPESAVGQSYSGGKEGNLNLLCTLPPCFRKKQDAAWKIMRSRAEEQNLKVIDGDAARQLFSGSGGLRYGSEYVQLDEKPDYDDLGMRCYDNDKKWRSLLKGSEVEVIIARHPVTGQRVELAPRKEARVIAKAKVNGTNAETEAKNLEQAQAELREQRREERRKQEIAKHTLFEGLNDLVDAITRRGMDSDALDRLFQILLDNSGSDGMRFMKDWLRVTMPKGTVSSGRSYEDEILKAVRLKAVTPRHWQGYIVIAALAKMLPFNGLNNEDLTDQWERYGISKKDMERRAKAIVGAGKNPQKVTAASDERIYYHCDCCGLVCDVADHAEEVEQMPEGTFRCGACPDATKLGGYASVFPLRQELQEEFEAWNPVHLPDHASNLGGSFESQVKSVAEGAKPSDFIGPKPSASKEPEAYKQWNAQRMKLERAAKKLKEAA